MNSRLIVCAFFAATASLSAAEKHPYNVKGIYSEACSCDVTCSCEMTGLKMGCEGVGALQITSGTYDGQDLSGLKAAYATQPGQWVRLYVQTANPKQAKAAREFLTAVYSERGKVESIKDAKIDIKGNAGNYTVTVDDGKVMKYQTKAVLGADKKTAIAHSNIADPLNSTFMQAKNESCTYKDDNRAISLDEGKNAFFNDQMDGKGEI